VSGDRDALEGAPKSDFANIPLPPDETEGEPVAAAAAPAAPPLVAVLDFLEPRRLETPFAHPFRWNGEEVRGFAARRLSLAEVGRLVESARGQEDFDPIEFYSVMTGLPAAVIRGLDADDGELLVETCYPFLPRVAQQVISLVAPGTGDGSA
jgi:hypothetical protein